MLTEVVKSNGDKVKFDPSKLNKWGEWAGVYGVDWSRIVLEAVRKCYDGCTTKELQQAMIDACCEKEDEKYFKMAGRLLIGSIYKEVFGGHTKIPTLKDFYHSMTSRGLWDTLSYSDDELDIIGKAINHKKDMKTSYPELNQTKTKYLISDRVTGKLFESPQFMYMGMALANMEQQPKERRVDDVIKLYEYLSDKKINAPTPFMVNLRTRKRNYASCCVTTTEDTAESLAAADHITYLMTCASAGIGHHIKTRSKGDSVRAGQIKHLGKLPYYRMTQSTVHANLQNSRGGAATMHYNALDPEIEDLLVLKNPTTTEQKRIREIDYSFGTNKLFASKVAKGEDWMLVSYGDAPELYEAFYSQDQKYFEVLYNKVASDPSIKKKMVSARDIAVKALNESIETGRVYLHWADRMNTQTPFNDKIYSSNLCVAPETKILTSDGYQAISELENKEVSVWNGFEWSKTIVRKTGENQPLITVEVGNKSVGCTHYHKFYLADGSVVEAKDIKVGDELLSWTDIDGNTVSEKVSGIIDNGRLSDTFCFNEPKRHMGVFNGILTGQCQEIGLPTKGYNSVTDLYSNNDVGEIGLCSLSAIVAGRVSDDEYYDVAYYTLLMIDNVIELMDYPFPQLKFTAQSRRSIGVGITNLAHAMAKNNLKYSSEEGKNYIHRLAERHSFSLHKASLQLAKEKGLCRWIDKTKYPQGWFPHDDAVTAVDSVHSETLHCDWESLRKEIVAFGGIRHSVLEAHMPCESSSVV